MFLFSSQKKRWTPSVKTYTNHVISIDIRNGFRLSSPFFVRKTLLILQPYILFSSECFICQRYRAHFNAFYATNIIITSGRKSRNNNKRVRERQRNGMVRTTGNKNKSKPNIVSNEMCEKLCVCVCV